MTVQGRQLPKALVVACLGLSSLVFMIGQEALAVPVSTEALNPVSPLLDFEMPGNGQPDIAELGTASGAQALNAISRGRWSSGCNIATKVLASKVSDVDALGVFALCSAIHNDMIAASTAIKRLQEAEPAPFYGLLTMGVLSLRDNHPEKADTAFSAVLKSSADNPLALYFKGEALHAQRKDADAMAAFKAVLKTWPDHVPALTAIARLLSVPNASKENLADAIAMTERATRIEPGNLAHWRLLAQLCEQTGQYDRANAIRLQWLNGVSQIK